MIRRIFLITPFLLAGLISLVIAGEAPDIPTDIVGVDDDAPAHRMVASANPHASRAGIEILRAGGSAVDAAVAVQMVLSLVEPQSSGIGGGAFMLHHSEGGGIEAYDGREVAPAAVKSNLFLDKDGAPESKRDVMPGGRSVGVPGVIAMLALAHREHGKLAWKDLFEPAIALAQNGFAVSPRLHSLIAGDKSLMKFPASRAYFYTPDGDPLPMGHVLKNPALADTLSTIAEEGPEAFYKGPLAADMVAAVQSAPINPGQLSLEDITGYMAKKRVAVCASFRIWNVCGMPPPSSGGIAVIQILKMLEADDLSAYAPGSVAAVNLIAETARLAYADRATYLGDSDFVDVPIVGLVDGDYLRARRHLVSPGKIMQHAPAGLPPGASAAYIRAEPSEVPATTHYSIVDGLGNVLAMTSSVESAFGSRMLVRGFLLNNQLTDFTFVAEQDGKQVANRVAAGKRPLSSMSPTLVFDQDGRPVATLGSPGGPLIITFVAKTLIGVLDWDLSIQDAINLSNFIHFGETLYIERGSPLAAKRSEFEAMGYKVGEGSLASGLHGIVIRYTEDGRYTLEGGADPRREGTIEAD